MTKKSLLVFIYLFILILILSGDTVHLIKPEISSGMNSSQTIGNDLPSNNSHPYPRLGMWWLDPYTASAQDIARYDLLLQDFDYDAILKEKYKQINRLNSDQINLKPLSPSERQLFMYDWETDEINPNPEISNLPSDFFLLQTGANLVESINESTILLKLDRLNDDADQPLFHLGGEVAIGSFESAKIVAINWANNTLEVQRGYVRAASPHAIGEKVASHIRFWPGSWVMNVTAACPVVNISGLDKPDNWIGYYFNLINGNIKGIYRHETDNYNLISKDITYDGFIIDRFEDKESWLKWINDGDVIELDLYHDFSVVSDEEFDSSWKKGTDQLQTILIEAYPDSIIIRNNPISKRLEPYNGQVYETSGWTNPSQEWWEDLVINNDAEEYYSNMPYLSWFENHAGKEPLVLFEVYADESGPDADGNGEYDNPFLKNDYKPDYKRMRFSLTTTLLGDGYYSYEINTNGHGALGLLWFDEYDNAGKGKGYLGYPVSKPTMLASGIYMRYFDNGVVLVNPTEKTVSVDLPSYYQKIMGTQDVLINSGEILNKITIDAYDGIILLNINE
ncbi:MAG: hypothetical protein C0410_05025 [Anaerolinea sp.]|nr:hypothetical protein [Anaerolinea sp.]